MDLQYIKINYDFFIHLLFLFLVFLIGYGDSYEVDEVVSDDGGVEIFYFVVTDSSFIKIYSLTSY